MKGPGPAAAPPPRARRRARVAAGLLRSYPLILWLGSPQRRARLLHPAPADRALSPPRPGPPTLHPTHRHCGVRPCPLETTWPRDRGDASDFTAALDDYRQLVRRSLEAEAMRRRFEGLAAAAGGGEDGGGGGGLGPGGGAAAGAAGVAAEDLRLRDTITLKLSKVARGLRGAGARRARTRCRSGTRGAQGFARGLRCPH
jgi:hypothetical protein